MLSVLERCGPGFPTEKPLKISDIVKAAFQADLGYRHLAGLQKMDHPGQTDIVDIVNRRFSHSFFEKAAEILFVHAGKGGQVPDVQFFVIVLPYVGQNSFYGFHPLILLPPGAVHHAVLRQQGQDLQQRSLDLQLGNRTVGIDLFPGSGSLLSPAESLHDPFIFLAESEECRMGGVHIPGEGKGSPDQRLDDLLIRGIIGLKAEKLGIEDNSQLLKAFGKGGQLVKFSPVDKEKALLIHLKGFHIDVQTVFSGLQINKLNFLMPVRADPQGGFAAKETVESAGKQQGPMGTVFS